MSTSNQNRPAQAITLYRYPLSGHCHRVELFLSLLNLPTNLVHVDLMAAEQKTPEFLVMNIFGQVPVIVDGDVTLADSNAILVYLAKRYAPGHWLPEDAVGAAEVERWLSVSAGLIEFGPAAARLIKVFNSTRYQADEVIARAHGVLGIMELVLQESPYLTGAQPTIADLANYTYIAHAPEGAVSLSAYPRLRAWLSRIEALPGFIGMAASPTYA